ncbi:MAG: T9SS type A sorting domain-containing protein [Bacteroidota bacterium]
MKLILILLFSAMTALAQTPEWSRKYHMGSVTCLDFSSDGGKLLSGGKDGQVILYSTKDGSNQKNYPRKYGDISSIQFSQNGEWFVSTGVDNGFNPKCLKTSLKENDSLQLLFVPTNVLSPAYDLRVIGKINYLSTFLIGDTTIYLLMSGEMGGAQASLEYSGKGGLIHSYSAVTGQKISENVRETVAFDVVCKSRDLKNLFMAGQYVKRLYGRHGGVDYDEMTSFDRSFILNTDDNTIQNDPFPRFLDHSWIQSACFITRALLIQNTNGYIYTKKINSDTARISPNVSSKTSLATALASDFTERYYISTHIDSTLRLWTPGIPNIFKRIQLLSPVTTIAVSPDSIHFATAHIDGTVAFWNIDSLAAYAAIDSVFTPQIKSISAYNIICLGEDAEFKVTASSNFGEELSYQWQKNGVDLEAGASVSGVQSATLLLKSIDTSDAGAYSVKITSATKPQSISASVSLTVKNIPVFKKPIVSQYSYTGQNYTPIILFHAELTDSVYAYFQWFKNGVEIPGAVESQYYFERKDSALYVGEYTVRVTNLCGDVISNSVIIKEIINSVEENPFKNTQFSAEPNPFKNSTTIHFSLPKSLQIKLAVTDMLGREVAILKDEFMEIGEQNVVFKNENLPDGMYFITLSGEGVLKTIGVKIIR